MMRVVGVALITGSAGLVGSACARRFAEIGLDVVGIDSNERGRFFGADASTIPTRDALRRDLAGRYAHYTIDVRDRAALVMLLQRVGPGVRLVVHAAAQPSHDYSARHPIVDFETNANGTLYLLDAVSHYAPGAVFVFLSTNKVYGDHASGLPLDEHASRFDLPRDHEWFAGVTERMSLDATTHSPFGVSKAAADLMVQEYGRYFGVQTTCLRGGTLTGAGHAAAELHGFLAFLARCCCRGEPYTIFGHGGKQVRDVFHADDVAGVVEAVWRSPPEPGAVFNMGGGRASCVSVLEAVSMVERASGRQLDWSYDERARIGDHRWWVSSMRRFGDAFPAWSPDWSLERIVGELVDRWD